MMFYCNLSDIWYVYVSKFIWATTCEIQKTIANITVKAIKFPFIWPVTAPISSRTIHVHTVTYPQYNISHLIQHVAHIHCYALHVSICSEAHSINRYLCLPCHKSNIFEKYNLSKNFGQTKTVKGTHFNTKVVA